MLRGAAGHDLDLEITGCYNSAWVTLRSEIPHQAQLRSVHFRGSGFWRLDSLDFFHDGAGNMVRLEDHGTQGPARNIQIVNSHFTSGDLPEIQDWLDHVSDGMRLYSDDGPVVARCNEMTRVAMGFVASGSHIDLIGNRVEFFSRDGIATGGHFNRFVGNRIFDSVALGDGHHDDFFQSHMGAGPDTSADVEITGNLFMNRYPSEQTPGTFGPTQCLSGFEDGPKVRLRITNNVCKADHWHGITWYDTNDSVVVNNTVVGGSDYPGLPEGSDSWPTRTWISIEGTGNIVRNNITTRNLSGGDHNHEILPADVDVYFTNWLGLDLTLTSGSPAIDDGNPDEATTHDILGVSTGLAARRGCVRIHRQPVRTEPADALGHHDSPGRGVSGFESVREDRPGTSTVCIGFVVASGRRHCPRRWSVQRNSLENRATDCRDPWACWDGRRRE